MVHKIQLTNYTARLVSEKGDLKLGTQNSYGTEQLQLILSPEWRGLTITATFYAPGTTKGTRVLADADGIIAVPSEATSGTWTIQPGRIVFAGISDGVQRISYDLSYTVISHSEIEGEPSKATPSILAQVIAQAGEARDKAVSAASEAVLAQLAAESASENIATAVETTKSESLNAMAAAKAEAIADIQATKEGSVKAIQTTQTIIESSIAEKQASALTTIKTLQLELEQTIADAKTESLNSFRTECDTYTERLESLVPDVYTKSESNSHFVPISATIRPTVKGNPVVCENSIAWGLQGLKVYGKSVQNGIPNPENPAPIVSTGDSGELSINIYGSNLANLFPQNGILEWVASTYPNSRLQVIAESIPPGTYIFDFDEFYSTNGGEQSLLIYARRKYSEHLYGLRRRKSFTVNEYFSLVIYVQNNDNKTYVVTNARLNYGSIVHPYEPCVFQILTHSFQQHLLGIPVISDGNYIDASGQQFICDLIDFEKGIKIQNIGEVDNNIWNSTPFTGDGHQFKATISGKSNTPILCTNYPYYVAPDTTVGDYITNDASGAQICVRTLEKDFDTIEAFKEYIAETEMRTFYVLAKPIITFLSNEEITAYRNLTTYKGATTILSTPEPVAGIESTYIMDCNKYRDSIEERFASIETKLASITI